MFKNFKVLKYLNSVKGNIAIGTLITLVGAFLTGFLFNSLENLTSEQKQRIGHMSNVFEMARALKNHVEGLAYSPVDGKNFDINNSQTIGYEALMKTLGCTDAGSSNYDIDDCEFGHGQSISLNTLIDLGVMIPGNDKTATIAFDTDTAYDGTKSIAQVKYVTAAGDEVTSNTSVIADVQILVNLAASVSYESPSIKDELQASYSDGNTEGEFYYFISVTDSTYTTQYMSTIDVLDEGTDLLAPEAAIHLPNAPLSGVVPTYAEQ